MKPSAPVRSSSPASILAKISSNAPDAAICAATSAPLLGCSSATRSIVVLSDGPTPYTENLTPPSRDLPGPPGRQHPGQGRGIQAGQPVAELEGLTEVH